MKNKGTYLFKLLQMFIVVGSIPDFEEIPKTPDTFWKETTGNKLIDGSDGGAKVKVYKDQGSAFIRCHEIEPNNEYIHILQQDGLISDGIYRERHLGGNTAIGSHSQYFRRSGREEGRWCRLYRLNRSGKIEYQENIFGRDDSFWRRLATYFFNQETLIWTKV